MVINEFSLGGWCRGLVTNGVFFEFFFFFLSVFRC